MWSERITFAPVTALIDNYGTGVISAVCQIILIDKKLESQGQRRSYHGRRPLPVATQIRGWDENSPNKYNYFAIKIDETTKLSFLKSFHILPFLLLNVTKMRKQLTKRK